MYTINATNSVPGYANQTMERNADVQSQVVFLYTSMSIKTTIKRAVDLLRRRATSLIELHVYLHDRRVLGSHYTGIKSVSIDEIIGSEGKSEDFDRSFNANHDRTRTRWMNVAKARLVGRELPPVELIQIENRYFVRDGHHRISVARALGENYIDAEVTQWEVEPLAEEITISCVAPKVLLAGHCA
jgi:hypothetical protein